MIRRRPFLTALVLWGLTALPVQAGEATVAVAANFLETAERLAVRLEETTGHRVTIAHGSTGRIYAQIIHGAPFDLFLSADAERPARLMEAGRAAEPPVTYAIGRLVILSRSPKPSFPADLPGARIAIANAQVAPYGAAAEEVLARWGIGADQATILRGESVGQTAGLFATGNADFAIVSAAQAEGTGAASIWPVPDDWHSALVQDAVLLGGATGAPVAPAARAFLDLLTGPAGRAVIAEDGYDLPVTGAD